MVKEYEGKTEREAIEKAAADLGMQQDQFDVEILESEQKGLFFKRGNVKIKVYVNEPHHQTKRVVEAIEPSGDIEQQLIDFLKKAIELMGYPGEVSITFREKGKIGMDIQSDHSAILIGKKGKNLDALQMLVNVFASKIGGSSYSGKVIIDTENYRQRREENLVRLATKTAEQVCKSRSSKLLEPMNPFERRLVHMALNEMDEVMTKSEGEGLYKQVRIIYKGSNS
ncbi:MULTISPECIES: RNA-binding cell elongation regulator Jag/EloR [unclassified Oceanispirochaeta]|uniref:RNA-binding cell elongation regulator Jag/EloR n=1 Tax=unclassified Oceanispirochaeta TaxID=2635722 RepID=UPI000E09C00C|nr:MULTISPECIES: RNA-binding cell elongation regulator Jag/EloR [unclassified Oceanispirochaeta]MBF9015242.1 protein jag [Oceanispirochaeta sp. M2]NPD71700.1 protein jag [Oceanispirochaeta sp. M1]RDG32894.1 protein jag [Oceanispirochaeta sp. M1]